MQQWLPSVTDVTAHSLHVHLPDVIAAAIQIANHVCSTISNDLHKHIITLRSIQATCTVDDNRTTKLSDSSAHTTSSSAKHNTRKNIVQTVLQVDSTAVQSLESSNKSNAVEHSSKDSNTITNSITSVIVDSLHAGVVHSILPLAVSQECITALNTVFQAVIEHQHSIGQQVSLQLQQASDALLTYSSVIGNDDVLVALAQCCCTEIRTLSTCKLFKHYTASTTSCNELAC
jgi:hypothetical protein